LEQNRAANDFAQQRHWSPRLEPATKEQHVLHGAAKWTDFAFQSTALEQLISAPLRTTIIYQLIYVLAMSLLTLKKREFAAQRSPTLNTVLMVEETLQKAESVLTVAELKRALPRQIMHQTLIGILDYLSMSGKIVFHENKVLWTFAERTEIERLKERGIEL
jgi:hypothetical protein